MKLTSVNTQLPTHRCAAYCVSKPASHASRPVASEYAVALQETGSALATSLAAAVAPAAAPIMIDRRPYRSTSLSAHLTSVSRPPTLGTLDAANLQALEVGDEFP